MNDLISKLGRNVDDFSKDEKEDIKEFIHSKVMGVIDEEDPLDAFMANLEKDAKSQGVKNAKAEQKDKNVNKLSNKPDSKSKSRDNYCMPYLG